MRRGVTVLVVVVVAAIALAAGIDALRGGSDPEPAGQGQSEPVTPSAAEPISGPALNGTLYYTDADCRLQAMELPGRTPAPVPNWDECSFVLSPDATSVSGAGTAWDPTGDHLFHARDGRIVVLSSDQEPEGEPFPGAAPAWRPDGTLTYFADGAVREWPSGDVVLSQRNLVRALRTGETGEMSTLFDRFRVREAGWLDERRLAAILSADGPDERMDLLAIYDGRELDAYTFDGPGGLSELRVSPGGRYVAAGSTGGRDADFVMLQPGIEWRTPRIVGYRALAWSPDEQWIAIAGEEGLFVYRPGAPGPPVLELELDAQDLAWRGGAGPPASRTRTSRGTGWADPAPRGASSSRRGRARAAPCARCSSPTSNGQENPRGFRARVASRSTRAASLCQRTWYRSRAGRRPQPAAGPKAARSRGRPTGGPCSSSGASSSRDSLETAATTCCS